MNTDIQQKTTCITTIFSHVENLAKQCIAALEHKQPVLKDLIVNANLC